MKVLYYINHFATLGPFTLHLHNNMQPKDRMERKKKICKTVMQSSRISFITVRLAVEKISFGTSVRPGREEFYPVGKKFIKYCVIDSSCWKTNF